MMTFTDKAFTVRNISKKFAYHDGSFRAEIEEINSTIILRREIINIEFNKKKNGNKDFIALIRQSVKPQRCTITETDSA